MKARIENVYSDRVGDHIVLLVAPESVGEARRLFDAKKGDLRVTFANWREKRSLTANAYFHALANKLASVLRISDDDCKRMLVLSYGTVAEQDGLPVVITLPKAVRPEYFYPYCEQIFSDGSSCSYQLYKQTHQMTTAEFSRLLDGTIQECKEQGIETLTPAEIASLYAQASADQTD